MRILVTGAAGRLGGRLVETLGARDHAVIGVDVADFDIADFAATNRTVGQIAPALIIHAAAWTDVDGCARDPEQALRVNGYGAQNVALAAAAVGAAILYVSSNEVFSGTTKQPYREYDATAPINPYGYSKWVGERAVLTLNPRHYVVRTAWLFAHGGKNFVQSILNAATQGKPLRVVTDEIANPTYTDDLAAAIADLIETERYGIYHLVNEGACSRYEFARHILDRTGHIETHIEPITLSEWPRASTPPPFAALENLHGKLLGVTLRPWQAAVDAFLEREGRIERGAGR
ncbi:MAG: dTDP-4-dehydrorhamnose reductase [Chloroflexi bacterium]|nr:dTDP-4-dehydrorhamnose reductase [Chloroflexota bacterium]